MTDASTLLLKALNNLGLSFEASPLLRVVTGEDSVKLFIKAWRRFLQAATPSWLDRHILTHPRRLLLLGLLGLLGLLLPLRSLPYLVPIRANDIAQQQLAVTLSDRNGMRLGTLLTHD